MKKKTTAFAFLDTNIYLEFKDFDQIDWPVVLGYSQVCIVIAPITLTELERFKYDQKSERRQTRSRLITRKLHDIIFSVSPNAQATVPKRSGVTLLALTDSPDVYSYVGLESTIADDQLIASVLAFIVKRPDIDRQDILLIGDDSGCLNKARARSIAVRRLDDQFRLPDEPLAVQKELSQLKRQFHDLQAKQPKLSLAIKLEEGPKQEIDCTLALLRMPTPDVFVELCDKEKSLTHWEDPKRYIESEDANSSVLKITGMIEAIAAANKMRYSKEDIDAYENQRNEYLKKYQKYLHERFQWEEQTQRRIEFTLTVVNDGVVPALGVVIRLIVPDELMVYDEDQFPLPPRPPTRPNKPRTEMQRMLESFTVTNYLPHSFLHSTFSEVGNVDPNDAGPDITPYNSILVQWTRPKVLHHLHLELTPIVLEFPRIEGKNEYELRYELIADNIPEPTKSIIKLKIHGQEQAFDLKQSLAQSIKEEEEYSEDE